MNTKTFSNYLQKLEDTTKRLEITTILCEFIKELEPQETAIGIYLALGYLKAPFESQRFNIAEKMVLRALEQTFATTQNPNVRAEIDAIYKEKGDLGDVVAEMHAKHQKNIKPLELAQLYEKLQDIASQEGSGSQEGKIGKLAALIKSVDSLAAKYAVRIVLGTTRLGFTELTVIAALAEMLGDKTLSPKIEEVYSFHPDIGVIAQVLKQKGMAGLKNIGIETGVPILSQKAQRVSGMEEAFERIPNVWAEFKFDGTRVQLHLDKNKKASSTETNQKELFSIADSRYLVKTFTRNLEDTTHQYPDIVEAARKQIKADSVILDGEGIGFNKETGEFLPFQETMQRKRKHDIVEMTKNVPLKYYAFDILFLNGESVAHKSLQERHALLHKVIAEGDTIKIAEKMGTTMYEDLEEYYDTAKRLKLEGLIVKDPDKPYQAGARSYSWIKLKKADEKLLTDSVDCVVLGYYNGRGTRAKFGIGGFLAGVYDEKTDSYKTLSKIGTGLTEDSLEKMKTLCDKLKVAKPAPNVEISNMLLPDTFVKPQLVVEIGADEISVSPAHTAGYALRFPRLLKFREDKPPTEATTLKEIQRMFKTQRGPAAQ